ncbi:hypothetical protein V1477_006853 [Vespula maculifrons]|uniref:Uncharacterized protein n=2 Tax=Vespula TaxID=7451 RepID=A0A834K0M3_VESVU|nr:hypothetical protein HZH66_008200 [Vespula vulgaris]
MTGELEGEGRKNEPSPKEKRVEGKCAVSVLDQAYCLFLSRGGHRSSGSKAKRFARRARWASTGGGSDINGFDVCGKSKSCGASSSSQSSSSSSSSLSNATSFFGYESDEAKTNLPRRLRFTTTKRVINENSFLVQDI